MFQKAIACVLTVLLVFSLAGCSSGAATPSPSAAEITVTGVVTDAAMNTLTVKMADGAELSFSTMDATVDMKDGLLLGDTVAITYTGDIKDGDTSGASVTLVRDGADNSKNPLRLAAASESAAPDAPVEGEPAQEQSITGTVQAIGMSAVTIKTDDGTELSFLMDGVEITVSEGPLEGDRLTLVYTGTINGTDTSGATALRLQAAE